MGVVAAELEVGGVLGVQGIGPEGVGVRPGRPGGSSVCRPPPPTPAYLEKLNLLKVTVFLMNRVKFSAWRSRGFLQGGGGM